MPVLEFGTGLLYGVPNAGNLPANPTPVRLLLQEVQVEFKGDLKMLWATSQLPIAKARGKVQVSGKAKIVNFDPDPINQLFFANAIAPGIEIPIDRELQNVPPNTSFVITVTNAATFANDRGVSYNSGNLAGAMLLNVPSAPAVGQYAVNATTGVYTFNAADNSLSMAISYTFTNATRGKTITLTNQLMGFAPEFVCDVWSKFRNKVFGLRLNSCVMGNWSVPTKLEDFWVADVAFDASTDATDTLGKIFADTF